MIKINLLPKKKCKKCGTIRVNRQRCSPCTQEVSKSWRGRNTEKKRASNASWLKNNVNRRRQYKEAYNASRVEHNASVRREYYINNRDAQILSARNWAIKNPDKTKRNNFLMRLRRYNLTEEIFFSILAHQGERCALCKSKDSGRRDWCIDHDHKCCPDSCRSCGKCVRGLLCNSCNPKLQDSIDIAMSIPSYLTNPPARQVLHS